MEAGVPGGVSPAAIDINMGCPVPKVVNNGEGSALLKDPTRAAAIVSAVKKAVSLPVTVKIRLGWDEEHLTGLEVAKACEEAGADLLVVHGRTRKQMYAGEANLSEIARIKASLRIPVVGNGDIRSAADAQRMLKVTGCDGLMVGRGAVGNPFVFREIRCMLEGIPFAPPTLGERLSFAKEQLEMAILEKGERIAVNESRKQLAEVIRNREGAAALRHRINTATSYAEIREILSEISELSE
jgi:nifR3 family TIM-barrel protein